MQVLRRFIQPTFLSDGGCVDKEYNATNSLEVGKRRCSEVAQLAVAGGVKDNEVARALKGRVARRAVMRRGGNMRVW